ncbi:hypothetical protein JCM30394_06830 [Deferrisoma palaeochoriense]
MTRGGKAAPGRAVRLGWEMLSAAQPKFHELPFPGGGLPGRADEPDPTRETVSNKKEKKP